MKASILLVALAGASSTMAAALNFDLSNLSDLMNAAHRQPANRPATGRKAGGRRPGGNRQAGVAAAAPAAPAAAAISIDRPAPEANPGNAPGLEWTLFKDPNPNPDMLDAYPKIEAAMRAAVARHARLGTAKKNIKVYYAPGVPTAEASDNGDLRFGSNRVYMNERTALHEIGHTLGVGQSGGFNNMCGSGDWKTALPLLKSFDGPDAKINCGGGHFWPYGLNYDNEWSEQNADRNVLMLNAMLKDGM